MIRSLSNEFSLVKALCRALGVSRSGYYAGAKEGSSEPRAKENARLGAKIKEVFEAEPTHFTAAPGWPWVLRRTGGNVRGGTGWARLMRARTVCGATQKRRFRPRTTDSRHLCPIAPNRLAERPPPARPGEVWQTDITYVATQEGWLYVAGVLDAYSRKIVGWAADDTMPHRPGGACLRARGRHAAARARVAPPLGPRQPVCQRYLS